MTYLFLFCLFTFFNKFKATYPDSSSCNLISKTKCVNSKYYSIDGSCNNLNVFWWGMSNTPYTRYEKAYYDDKVSSPRLHSTGGYLLPNAREIALRVHYPKSTVYDKNIDFSLFATIFGQFVAFDLTHIVNGDADCSECDTKNAECMNIPTPSDDKLNKDQKCMIFTRSAPSFPTFNCSSEMRDHLNSATHWWDLSQIYGSNDDKLSKLRDSKGFLKTNKKNDYLQSADVGTCLSDSKTEPCFISGDSRVNENMVLTSIFTLFSREHNRLASILKSLNPKWSGETLFQESRRILIAIYQKIIYEDFIPIILDSQYIKSFDLKPSSKGKYYMDYDSKTNPQISQEYATSSGRFGHTLVNEWDLKADNSFKETGNISFNSLILKSHEAYISGGMDALCKGSVTVRSRGFDAHFTDPIQNRLFEDPNPGVVTHRNSLSAFNINRGRDHGIGSYNVYRKFCKLEVIKSFTTKFNDIDVDTIKDLKKVYQS